MKTRCLAMTLMLVIFITSFLPSCDTRGIGYSHLNTEENFNVDVGNIDVRNAKKGFSASVYIKNSESKYKKAKLKINTGDFFEIKGYDSSEAVEIEFDEFDSRMYELGTSKSYVIRLLEGAEINGFLYGKITFNLILYEEGQEEKEELELGWNPIIDGSYVKPPKTLSYSIPFVSDGECIAFCRQHENYLSTIQKLPGYEIPLSVYSENPMMLSPYDIGGTLRDLGTIDILATIDSVERIGVTESMNIDVGIANWRENTVSGGLKIKADGFNISDADGNSFEEEYIREYKDFNRNNFGMETGEKNGVYSIYSGAKFDYSEHITLTLLNNLERSGSIEIIAWGDQLENEEYGPGMDTVTIYFATDGRKIAYSVDSEEAAQRELYGNFVFFWKVTVAALFK